jgi:hypothetical protein
MAIQRILQDKGVFLFFLLTGLFIGNTLVAEFIGGKIFSMEKLFGYSST